VFSQHACCLFACNSRLQHLSVERITKCVIGVRKISRHTLISCLIITESCTQILELQRTDLKKRRVSLRHKRTGTSINLRRGGSTVQCGKVMRCKTCSTVRYSDINVKKR
jgi:hypothetical protein